MNRKNILPAALVAYIAALLALVVACKKDPIPEPTPTSDIPTDTITPSTPGDTIVPPPTDTITPGDTISPPPHVFDTANLSIKRNNATGGISYPSVDTIQKLLDMNKIVNLRWRVPPNLTNGWTPDAFHSPRDSLRSRFAMSPNVIGNGIIYVNENYGGASIPCEDSLCFSKLGMTECDSAIFAGWGYEPTQLHFGKSRAARIKFLDNVGMNRAILGKQR